MKYYMRLKQKYWKAARQFTKEITSTKERLDIVKKCVQ